MSLCTSTQSRPDSEIRKNKAEDNYLELAAFRGAYSRRSAGSGPREDHGRDSNGGAEVREVVGEKQGGTARIRRR